MNDPLQTIIYGPRRCPGCGATNLRNQTYCMECGQRLHNRNPVLRFFITLAAVGLIAAVVWAKLRW